MPPADSAAPSQPLECRLEAVPPLVAGGPVKIGFTLRNTTQAPVRVLRWNTPLEGWKGTILQVSFQGFDRPYQGPMFKRGEPGREEYVEIPAGESVSATVDLSQAYEMKDPGPYQVKVVGGLQDVVTGGEPAPRPLEQHQPGALSCGELLLNIPPAGGAP
jgi:hypothetical protein